MQSTKAGLVAPGRSEAPKRSRSAKAISSARAFQSYLQQRPQVAEPHNMPRTGRTETIGRRVEARAGRSVRVCCDTGIVVAVGSNTLVGRDAELGHLLAVLESAAAGRPVVTLISGDAGVG